VFIIHKVLSRECNKLKQDSVRPQGSNSIGQAEADVLFYISNKMLNDNVRPTSDAPITFLFMVIYHQAISTIPLLSWLVHCIFSQLYMGLFFSSMGGQSNFFFTVQYIFHQESQSETRLTCNCCDLYPNVVTKYIIRYSILVDYGKILYKRCQWNGHPRQYNLNIKCIMLLASIFIYIIRKIKTFF
jgi:hypothetical protein